MLPDVIFIMGPQGSGKDTQAHIIADRFGYIFWGMGSVLREEHDYRLSDGKTVGEIIDTGAYLNDPQLIEVLKHRLTELPADKKVTFEGMPRRIGQAEFILDFLRRQGRKSFYTFYLNIPREESVKRILLRAKTEGRADDTGARIEKRLKQHQENTVPILGYMREHTNFVDIDGRPAIPEVAAQIERVLAPLVSK